MVNNFVCFRTTRRRTTLKARYLSLNTNELIRVRKMVREMNGRNGSRRRKILRRHSLSCTISLAAATLLRRRQRQQMQTASRNHMRRFIFCVLLTSLLRMIMNKLRIRRIRKEYYNLCALFEDDFDPNSHSNSPKMNRTITSLSEVNADSWTRHTKDELRELLIHLRLPNMIKLLAMITGPLLYQFIGS